MQKSVCSNETDMQNSMSGAWRVTTAWVKHMQVSDGLPGVLAADMLSRCWIPRFCCCSSGTTECRSPRCC